MKARTSQFGDRQAEPDQIKHFELLPGPAPIRHHGPGKSKEKERREGQEMGAEKPEHFERTDAERLIEPTARLQMRERDPGVFRVPDDRRRQTKRESAEQKIELEALEFLAMTRHERQNQQHRNELERVRVFAKKTEPDEQTSRGPEPVGLRTALQRQPESEHGRRPKKD
jgi:hypothetical protein